MLDTVSYNALSLAQPTNFRAMLQSGELLWGTSCRILSEEAAKIVATLPHHFCFIDMEHTPLNATLLANLIKTIQYYSAGSMVPYVRIPSSAPDMVTHALNAGAGGIVVPHVQNASQAEALVRLAKFPTLGDRSYPPMMLFGKQTQTKDGQTVYDVWNQHAAVFCQIEDEEGVRNVDEIARVPGVDALMVGASDLRFSLGLEAGSQDGDEPTFLAALEKIQRAADENGLCVLGFAMSPKVLERRLKLGWRALIIHGDAPGIVNSGAESLKSSLKVAELVGNPSANGSLS
ncbi:HpcH/HpaI aldolase/citrate lyase family protein [Xylona heveae TC161]|uniref:HpcH/HpaI aldolase/citrate lyase family protein n=1 Tax=Xylona heveae (strain CBS 132557 / TC161) TaxID=1328760 RepID=A0A165FGM1_XYLHT|nr:HpcH/HpaI aldolase/citrate lyase family protein [Xylona heveae TC161]KZF20954.1 HpcH/HpaI aldolase/citrate lyase family protein [Xylona heveae TC161]